MFRVILTLFTLLAIAGCTSTPDASPDAAPSTAFAPTPFTAEQIRAGCPAGRLVRWQTQENGVLAQSLMRFDDPDARGVWFSNQPLGADGAPGAATPPAFATWAELRDHARFPAALTEVTHATITAAIGTCDCMIYRVRSPEAPETAQIFTFDVARPGPPIRLEVETDGVRTIVMEMLSDTTDGS